MGNNLFQLPNISGRKVLLIGGAGFIGHNLAITLKKLNCEVSIIDGLQVNNLLSLHSFENKLTEIDLYKLIIQERLDLLKKFDIPLFIEDARDYHKLGMLFDKLKPQVVIQLAAVSHASRSNKNPHDTFDHSFRTLENSLDCSRKSVEHFIYFSSSMVYGNFKEESVNEETICEPLGIYGALKYGGEKLVIAYNQVFNLPFSIIRPSALYGERCISRRVGQIFIENALRGNNICIKGDGEEKLDFTYIGDLVQGIVRIISNEKSKNNIFNLTYGEGRSLREMAEIILREFPQIELENVVRDNLVPERGTLDISKAKNLLNYEPENPLNVGYIKYIDWYRKIFCEKMRNDGTKEFQIQLNE